MASRTNQKNRTREALLSAARALMSEGKEVTLAKVAERAKTSRATVYRYFSDPSVLALDATLDLEVVSTSELLKGIDDVRRRVHAIARYYLSFSRVHEAYFRQFLVQLLQLFQSNRRLLDIRGSFIIRFYWLQLSWLHVVILLKL